MGGVYDPQNRRLHKTKAIQSLKAWAADWQWIPTSKRYYASFFVFFLFFYY